MFSYLFWALAVAVVGWFLLSLNYVKSNEVGLVRYWGKLDEFVHTSGIVFVPLFWGVDLVRIPTKMFRLSYEGKPEHQLYTKDRQLVMPQATFYVTFPYAEADSLVKLIQKDVPLAEEGLQTWAEDILIPALWQVLRTMDHSQLVSDIDLDAINNQVNAILKKDGSKLRECGVMGRNPDDTTSGTGQAFVQIEMINLTDELQKAMQSKVVAKYEADAAQETARMNAEQVGGQILGIVARMAGKSIEALQADLEQHPEKKGQAVKDGGYADYYEFATRQTTRDRAAAAGELTDIRVGGTNGEKIDGQLPGLAAAAVLFSRGGGRKGPGKKGGTTTDELEKMGKDLK